MDRLYWSVPFLYIAPRSITLLLVLVMVILHGCGYERTTSPLTPPETVGDTAYPTLPPHAEQGGSDDQMTMRMPGNVYMLDLAVHPVAGWPVVGVMQRLSISSDPIMAFVRVYNPQTKRWGPALQVDVGESSNGMNRFGSIVVGVTGDDTVHAVWGASDDAKPSLWASRSTDYGETWTEPERIAANCWFANAMATTPDGQLVVQASCFERVHGQPEPQATLIVRRADGTWLAPDRLDIPGWFGTVMIAGDGRDALATAFVTSHGRDRDTHVAYLISKYLINERDGWQIQTRRIAAPAIDEEAAGDYHWHPQSLAFPRQYADGSVRTGQIVMWTGRRRAAAYALTSFDGGLTWSEVQPIIYHPGNSDETGKHIEYVVPAYDVVADRFAAIYACCGLGRDQEASTQYASWSVPETGQWYSSVLDTAGSPATIAPNTPTPLVFGGRAVHLMDASLASNSRKMWIAWTENRNEIMVRSFELDTIIPVVQEEE